MKKWNKNRPTVRVEIAEEVLESVFAECDRYDSEETGGRVIGHIGMDGSSVVIQVKGVIEAGPKARRSATSFFQDGDYQTEVFRGIEAEDPSIEHLGNWHTHHMNGYPTLSGGDLATYRRIVNHKLHNLDIFYALLVTCRKKGRQDLSRYAVRHYVLFRGENDVNEISAANVKVTDDPIVWPKNRQESTVDQGNHGANGDVLRGTEPLPVRARDQIVLALLFPSLVPRLSTTTETFFWKGNLQLLDGSAAGIKVAEVNEGGDLVYYPFVSPYSRQTGELRGVPFASAAQAVRALEIHLNRQIYEAAIAE
jgi:hypothetical protein